jgi:hypothetical protein
MRAVIVVCLLASVAQADPRAIAEKNFRLGARAYKAQDFETAATDFEVAYEAMPLPEIAFSAAQAHRRFYLAKEHADDLVRAVELYKIYLQKVSSGGRVREAEDAIRELQRDYDKLAAAGKLGKAAQIAVTRLGVGVTFADQSEAHTIQEVDDQSGASAKSTEAHVDIDGKAATPNAYTPVEPGERVVHVTAPGYVPAEKRVPVIAGGTKMVDIELQPRPALVTVKTEDGSRISVDGRERGAAPLAALELAPGKHLLTIAHDGRELAGRDLEVTRGQQLALDVPLTETARRRSVKWVARGAGVAAVLSVASTGLAFYYQHEAEQDWNDLKNGDHMQQALDDYNYNHTWRDRHRVAAWTFGGAAVAIGLTAAWLYYFDKPGSEGVRVTPTGVAGQF